MKERKFHFGLGITSILMVFVILCIVTFSVLSYVSARADSNLSAGVKDNTTAYYQAGNQANTVLSEMDAVLEKAYLSSSGEEAYFENVRTSLSSDSACTLSGEGTDLSVSFTEPVADTQTLIVSVQILYPDTANPWYYKITQWETAYTAPWNADQSIHVLGS